MIPNKARAQTWWRYSSRTLSSSCEAAAYQGSSPCRMLCKACQHMSFCAANGRLFSQGVALPCTSLCVGRTGKGRNTTGRQMCKPCHQVDRCQQRTPPASYTVHTCAWSQDTRDGCLHDRTGHPTSQRLFTLFQRSEQLWRKVKKLA